MKMKKLLAILALVCVLFCSCGNAPADDSAATLNPPEKPLADSTELPDDVRISSHNRNLNLNGELYVDYVQSPKYSGDRLNFIDFDSMQSTVVCPKPNCPHDNPEVCSAFGMSHHPTIIDGKLFFFETIYNEGENGTFTQSTAIWQAQTDGTGRSKLYTVNYTFNEGEASAIVGDKIYFVGSSRSIMSAASEDDSCNICSYDFAKNEFTDYGELCKGWEAYAGILGWYDGGLYIHENYMTEKFESKVDYSDSGDEWEKQIELMNSETEEREKLTVRSVLRFDTDSGAFEETGLDLKSICFVDGDYFAYEDKESGRYAIKDSKGDVRYISHSLEGNYVNGYVFREHALEAYDIANDRIIKLNQTAVPQMATVVAYHDGKYILREQINMTYIAVEPENLFLVD